MAWRTEHKQPRIPEFIGADLYRMDILREQRLAELRMMTEDEIARLFEAFRRDERLPRLRLHFRKHGRHLSAQSPEEYEQRFLEHIRGFGLRYFTGIRAMDGARMWYNVDTEMGYVAQYNESQRCYWSFYYVDDLQKHLAERGFSWIEVRMTRDGLEFSDV